MSSMEHDHHTPPAWREGMEVVPRSLREYRNFTIRDQARVIAGDVHYNTIDHRGMSTVSKLHMSARHVLTRDL